MNKPVLYGYAAALGMMVFYFGVLSVANSFSHAVEQFGFYGYLLVPLSALVGVQVGLYVFIRESLSAAARAGTNASVAASGGMSGSAMVLCCLHHVADVFPLLGLSAAAVFLTQYQSAFLVVGIVSGAVGVLFLLEIVKKNGLAVGPFQAFMNFNLPAVRNAVTIFGVLVIGAVFLYAYLNGSI
ncbi:MAG: hypothetical protein HY917_02700 [Candidatus Diapherotrites archaeon]|nr:hypothetical protein [Candidatus Diapherotrites archaeon]